MTCSSCFDGRHIRCEERVKGCGCSVCSSRFRKRRARREQEERVVFEGIVKSSGSKTPVGVKVSLPDGSSRKKFSATDIQAVLLYHQPGASYASVAETLGYPNRYVVQSVVRRYRQAEEDGVLDLLT